MLNSAENISLYNLFVEGNFSGLGFSVLTSRNISFGNLFFENSKIIQNYYFTSSKTIKIQNMIVMNCFMNYFQQLKTFIYFIENINTSFQKLYIEDIKNYTESLFNSKKYIFFFLILGLVLIQNNTQIEFQNLTFLNLYGNKFVFAFDLFHCLNNLHSKFSFFLFLNISYELKGFSSF